MTLRSAICVRMTSTVNSPCWPTMDASHSSNSVGSEVDNGHLGYVLVEQSIERLAVRALEPGLECLQLRRDGRRRLAVARRKRTSTPPARPAADEPGSRRRHRCSRSSPARRAPPAAVRSRPARAPTHPRPSLPARVRMRRVRRNANARCRSSRATCSAIRLRSSASAACAVLAAVSNSATRAMAAGVIGIPRERVADEEWPPNGLPAELNLLTERHS